MRQVAEEVVREKGDREDGGDSDDDLESVMGGLRDRTDDQCTRGSLGDDSAWGYRVTKYSSSTWTVLEYEYWSREIIPVSWFRW